MRQQSLSMDTNDIVADAFERIHENVHRAVAGLDTDGLNFRPDAEANSIGWLVWHLTRVQDDHIAHLAGRGQDYTAGGWAERFGFTPDDGDLGFGHTSEQVAEIRFDGSADLLAYFEAVQAHSLEYVAALTPDELDRIVDTRWDPPVTAGVRLVSVIDDCIQHSGQAAYVRGLWERRSS